MNILELEKELNSLGNVIANELTKTFKDNVKIQNTSFPIVFNQQLSFDFCYEIDELNINKHFRFTIPPYINKNYNSHIINKLKSQILFKMEDDIKFEILKCFIKKF